MTPEQFCYWLQGFAELNGVPPDDKNWQAIREHLNTVFVQVTPSVLGPTAYPWVTEGKVIPGSQLLC